VTTQRPFPLAKLTVLAKRLTKARAKMNKKP
jgi:hypothetical protein